MQLVVGEVLRMNTTGAKGTVYRQLEDRRDREGVLMQRAQIRIFLDSGHHKKGDMVIWKAPIERSDER